MLNNKTILITGGTGSFGQAFTYYILKNFKPKKLIIFSRDEMKQFEMANKYPNQKNLRFFIGDVRDKDRLTRALDGVDYVVHAAASKIVPLAEYNPFEYIKTNIVGSMNLIDVSISCKVKKVIALSTDKASNPVNLYGATKMVAEKVFSAGNVYSKSNQTKFGIVRYGNVMGSRGSVIPFFLKIKNNRFPITDINMTRFVINLDQCIKMVLTSLKDVQGGEIFVPKAPSIKITEIAKVINPKCSFNIIGVRPGEKIHESLISEEESKFTYDYKSYYKLIPAIFMNKKKFLKKNIKKVKKNFSYTSGNNKHWMTKSYLKKWIQNNIKNFDQN